MIFKYYNYITPFILFIIIGTFFFPSAGRDDIHITYWAAYSLSNMGEILNYNGDRIEQSSSLLHTIILASINKITSIRIVNIGTYLSIFFGLTTVFLTGKLSILLGQKEYTSKILIATSLPLLYWSFGALETSLVSAIVIFIIIRVIMLATNATVNNYIISITAIFLYLLVRPEAVFVISLFLFIPICIYFFTKEKFNYLLVLLAFTIFFFLVITALRHYYFGSFFPQPVEAKIGTSLIEKFHSGFYYYTQAFKHYPAFFLVIPIIWLLTIKLTDTLKNKTIVIVSSFIITYFLFILSSGGDWMEGARFFVPINAPLIALAIYSFSKYIQLKRIIIWGLIINLLCVILFTMSYSTSSPITNYNYFKSQYSQSDNFSFFEIANRVHYRDIPFIVEFKKILNEVTAANINPKIMSVQAGMVPYHLFQTFYKKAEFIDLWGLSTKHFTSCEVTNALPKRTSGLKMTYDFLVSHKEELKSKCNISLPDIIYDLDNNNLDKLKLLEKSGYTRVFLQTGIIKNNGFYNKIYLNRSDITGGNVNWTQFIVIKTEIANQLSLKSTQFNFK
jgi:hypothetical protein